MTDLLPCPFCGSAATVAGSDDDVSVMCGNDNCRLVVGVPATTKERAVKHWNERKPAPPQTVGLTADNCSCSPRYHPDCAYMKGGYCIDPALAQTSAQEAIRDARIAFHAGAKWATETQSPGLREALEKIAAREPYRVNSGMRWRCPSCDYASSRIDDQPRHAPHCDAEIARAALAAQSPVLPPSGVDAAATVEEAMWMLQDVPGDTLTERIARLSKWYQDLCALSASVAGEPVAIARLGDAMVDRVMYAAPSPALDPGTKFLQGYFTDQHEARRPSPLDPGTVERCAKVVDRWISDITKAGDQFDKGGDIYAHANVLQGVASAIRALASPAPGGE